MQRLKAPFFNFSQVTIISSVPDIAGFIVGMIIKPVSRWKLEKSKESHSIIYKEVPS